MDRDYALFAKVVETGSLSAAGRALAISPAMVSKRLARLEERLGARLVHRTTRKLALTPAGQRFHGDVVAILQHVDDAERRVGGHRGEPAGPLRVSAPTSFGRLHVIPKLHLFLQRYDKVELEIDLSDAYVDLIADRIDVAIRVASDMPASLVAHGLGGNRRVLCASRGYLASHGTPGEVGDLARHRLLATREQLPWRLANGGDRYLVEGHSHVRTNSSEVIRELAITGVGIALRSLWDVEDALRDELLVPVLAGWEAPSTLGLYAVHPRAPVVPPAVTAFVAFLKQRVAIGGGGATSAKPFDVNTR